MKRKKTYDIAFNNKPRAFTREEIRVNLPQFKVIPNPHSTDKDYHIDHGENYYPDDVGGVLHELY